MSDRVLHCPFLNRADTRCSNHFSLDRLGHAFQHCFNQYKSCPTYLELLVERRVRRSSDMMLQPLHEADGFAESSPGPEPAHVHSPYVQLRISPLIRTDRYQKSVA